MKSLIAAAITGAMALGGAQAAMAFTYENQGTTQPSANAPDAKVGFGEMDPSSVLPPIGNSIQGNKFDFGPGAFNNGLASPPTRAESVGPSWLYPR
jgi:hypothetical protein